jgi:hypothetical protein
LHKTIQLNNLGESGSDLQNMHEKRNVKHMNSTIKEVNPKALQDKMKTMGFATVGKDHLD